jgi:protein TonB
LRRDLVIALLFSVLLHVGLAFGDRLFPQRPPPPAPTEEIPLIALTLPPLEPDEPPTADTSAPAPADATPAPPRLADVPSVRLDSPFVQPLAPPPPAAGTARVVSLIALPSGSGLGGGVQSIFNLADLDEQPEAVLRIKPDYPYDLLRAGVPGEAVLELTIAPDGSVRDVIVISATQRAFGEAARQAVLRWKFKPGKVGGRAVSFRRTLPVTFSIGAP